MCARGGKTKVNFFNSFCSFFYDEYNVAASFSRVDYAGEKISVVKASV